MRCKDDDGRYAVLKAVMIAVLVLYLAGVPALLAAGVWHRRSKGRALGPLEFISCGQRMCSLLIPVHVGPLIL